MTSQDEPSANERPLRADARRNRERLLQTAAEVFDELGPQAPLDEVAKRSGIGNATLYRHFPTRHALLLAVYADEVDRLCARARRSTDADPGEALASWLHALVEHLASTRGLAAAVIEELGHPDLSPPCRVLKDTTAAMLAQAQDDGAVHDGILLDDLLQLASGIAFASEMSSSGPSQAARTLDLALDGVRRPRAR